MRFNPPPNWPPVPPGWAPPPGWRPDPSWPAPPPGWPLWIPDRASGRRTALIVGAVAAVLLLAAGAALTVALTRDGSGPGPAARPSSATAAPAPSDEDQIIAVVEQFQEAWNGYEYDNLRALMCAEMRADELFSRANFAEMRDEAGTLNLTVTSVEVTGTTADTVIEHNGADPDDIAFSYENGGWKWCES